MHTKLRLTLLLIVGALLWPVAFAPLAQNQQLDVPKEYMDAVQRAELLGWQLFRHDRAAAAATDAVIAKAGARRVRGWITEERDDATVVRFVGVGEGDSSAALYAVAVPNGATGSPSVKAFELPVALSATQTAQFRARQLAITSQPLSCSASYNTVVLPTQLAGIDAWHVYLLPGTTRHGLLPASGYRLDVDAAGTTILARQTFSRSCIELENRPDAVALTITHLLDPSPTELHVFLSLLANKPLLVATSSNAYAWEIRNGRIVSARRLKRSG